MKINGIDLSGFDFNKGIGVYETSLQRIQSGVLKQGNNTIQVCRDTSVGDNFIVRDVVVHWKETVPSSFFPFQPYAVARTINP